MSRPRLSRIAFAAFAILFGCGLAILLAALVSLATCPARVAERDIWGSPALAQGEPMRFRRVPAESVTALDRRRVRRISIPAEPNAPPSEDEAAEPAPPASPLPPTRVDRSGDVMRIGSDVHIEEGEVVDGDVYALGGDVRIDGTVRGNVAATGGDVVLGSTAHVDGDVMCLGGHLTEEPGAFVGGQRVTARRRGHTGPLVHRMVRDADREVVHRATQGVSAFFWILFALGAAWAITRFAPVRTATALDTLKREPGMCLVVGLVILLLLLPSAFTAVLIAAILCITIIGIPLGLGLILAYAGALAILALWGWVVGVIPVGQVVGARTTHQPVSLTKAAMIGMLAICGLSFVGVAFHVMPFFGWLGTLLRIVACIATIVVTLMGAGSLVRSRVGQGPGGQWWPITRRQAGAVTVTGVGAAGSAVPPASPPPPSPPESYSPPPQPPPAAPRPEEPPPAPIG